MDEETFKTIYSQFFPQGGTVCYLIIQTVNIWKRDLISLKVQLMHFIFACSHFYFLFIFTNQSSKSWNKAVSRCLNKRLAMVLIYPTTSNVNFQPCMSTICSQMQPHMHISCSTHLTWTEMAPSALRWSLHVCCYLVSCGSVIKGNMDLVLVVESTTMIFVLQDFVLGLSVLLRGSVTEKLRWAFNLYDINKDGYITKEVQSTFSSKNIGSKSVAVSWFLQMYVCLFHIWGGCLFGFFSAGNVGNNDIHLWHDGQIYPTQCTRWFPLWARGEILPGVLFLNPPNHTV